MTYKEIEQEYKDKLEAVLDECFPKIDEECPEKIANKRGKALILFANAVQFLRPAVKMTLAEYLTQWLRDFANRPLNKRRGTWDEVVKIGEELGKFMEK